MSNLSPLRDEIAQKILRAFAEGTLTLPETEHRLQVRLGNQYCYDDWKPAFDMVFAYEDDSVSACTAIEEFLQRTTNDPVPPPNATSTNNPSAGEAVAEPGRLE